MAELDAFAARLDKGSKTLYELARQLEPVENAYTAGYETFIVKLWATYTAGDIRQWPGEDTRLALYHEQVRGNEAGAKFLTELGALRAQRDRARRVLDDIRAGVSARQSLLSALRAEMEIS